MEILNSVIEIFCRRPPAEKQFKFYITIKKLADKRKTFFFNKKIFETKFSGTSKSFSSAIELISDIST